MPFIESADHLTEYRTQVRAQRDPEQVQVLVCGGPGCLPLGSEELAAAFKTEMAAKGVAGKILLKTTGCQGLCSHGVRVLIRPQEITYQKVTPADVPEIVETTLLNNGLVERLLYHDPETQEVRPHKADIPFYQAQNPLVLRKLDIIDPESLDDYLALGGYRALPKLFSEMTPEQVIDAVERSGLRGRGGGGFPSGRKWRLCREAAGEVKFIICNGDEGDPGRFHGSGRHGRRPPCRHRRHDHRCLCHRAPCGAISMSGQNIPWPSNASIKPSSRPANLASWAPTSWDPASTSISKSARAPAPLSAAKKPPSSPPSKARSANPRPARLTRLKPACSACPPSSTMSKPGPMSLISLTWGPNGLPAMGTDKQQRHQNLLPGGYGQ